MLAPEFSHRAELAWLASLLAEVQQDRRRLFDEVHELRNELSLEKAQLSQAYKLLAEAIHDRDECSLESIPDVAPPSDTPVPAEWVVRMIRTLRKSAKSQTSFEQLPHAEASGDWSKMGVFKYFHTNGRVTELKAAIAQVEAEGRAE